MKIIDTEAHYYPREYRDYINSRSEIPREEKYNNSLRLWYAPGVWEPHGALIEDKLLEIGEKRLREMDEAGIDIQVLSLSTPGCEQFSVADGTKWSQHSNNYLHSVINKYPDRFVGLAALAPQDPEAAARELERAVEILGFRGAKINSHVGEYYLDHEKFSPIFETAEKLNVPIFLHPYAPSSSMVDSVSDFGFTMAGPAWGFGMEAATSVLRLIYRGTFDRYPNLKMVLGHLGEGLVFWIYRIDFAFKKAWMADQRPNLNKAPSEYLRNNFYINNSGMYTFPAFNSVFLEMGTDHLMFGADYPYESSPEAVEFMRKLPITEKEREKILYSTAAKLFKIE